MIDVQKLVDTMSAASRRERSNYHLTLGQLIAFLEQSPPDATVIFSDGIGLGDEASYRGYYSDLAFEDGKPKPVAKLLKQCKAALGNTYEGYKGGDFVMGADTPLWRSEYGNSGGAALIEAIFDSGTVILKTKQID